MSKYKTIFFSDAHLGLPESHAKDISLFLENNEFERLYIVGDLFDLWAMSLHPFWSDDNTRLINTILSIAQTKEVIYIPGNHDGVLKNFSEKKFGNVIIKSECDFITIDGKKLLITHGNKFDNIVSTHTKLSIMGSWANEFLFLLDPVATFVRNKLGLYKHWSLAGAIKRSIRNQQYVDSFKKLLTAYAKKNEYDGLIVGHLHVPEISTIDGVEYYN